MSTQRQIARELGLSAGTVSRALSNHPGINDQTRSRVLAAAAKVGYRPKVDAPTRGHARLNQASPAAETLGMLIYAQPESIDEQGTFVRVLRGASEAARQLGIGLHVDYVPTEAAHQIHLPEHQPALMRQGGLAGLLILGLFPPEAVTALSQKFPCVRLHLRDFGVPIDCIAQDDHGATDAIVRHLTELGHKRIGFFCMRGDLDYTYGRMRFAGYLESLVQHGLQIDPDLWVHGEADSSSDLPIEAFKRVEALTRSGVTAWVGVHDIWAYRLMRHLIDAGLDVPSDVALCGFDALPTPHGLTPLTSVSWPMEDMGATAVRRLYRRIHNPLLAVSQSLYTGHLKVGPSTVPASAAD